MKLAAWDIEIANEIPDGEADWKQFRPLGISCAAAALQGKDEPLFWHAPDRMDRAECQKMILDLSSLVNDDGYTLVTFNGVQFDWDVTAEESGLYQECAELCRNHVDLMFIVVAIRGHYLGLDTACQGMGVEGKLKEVQLKNGETLKGMSGAMAPQLWQAGEYQAVLDYLGDDVRFTLELAQAIKRLKEIRWISRSGRPNAFFVPRLYTVSECLEIPEPDTSWMSSPPSRQAMTAWMESIEEEEGTGSIPSLF